MDRLGAMETYIRVVDAGSFSAAARHLEIGQPAVSKAIAQLEQWLGVSLLLRSTRSITPTEAGRNFYDHAKKAIEEADDAVVAARGAASGLVGRLRVSASVCFARINIVPKLHTFLDLHPNLEIEMILDDRNIDLVEEGIDVALRMGDLQSSSLTARKIGECRRVALATPAYLEEHGEPKTPDELLAHQTVIYTRDHGGENWSFRKGTADASIRVQGRFRVSAAEGLREAVLAGMGIGIASEWVFVNELSSGAVRTFLNDWDLPRQNLWAVFPSGRRASTKTREFVDFVQTCIAPTPLSIAA